MKTTISLLGGIALGYFFSKALRSGLFMKSKPTEDLTVHSFAINELTAPGSVDLNELKEKIRRESKLLH